MKKYERTIILLLEKYINSKEIVIGEFSGNFANSYRWLANEVREYINKVESEEAKKIIESQAHRLEHEYDWMEES